MFVKLMSKCKTAQNRKEKSGELQFVDLPFSFYGEEYTGGLNSGHFNSHVILPPLHDMRKALPYTCWLPVWQHFSLHAVIWDIFK